MHGYVRAAFVGGAFLLPTLTLVPLGSIWLWQNGYLLHWALGSAVVVAAIYALERRLIGEVADTADAAAQAEGSSADPAWTPREEQAWAEVQAIAANTKLETLDSRDAVASLGYDVIQQVARRLHPERGDALWQFTVPEALAIVERVSARLRRIVIENVPLGDRLKVAQILGLYRWRGAVDIAERAYDVWRILRMANPITAATHEAREHLSHEMLRLGQEHLARRLVTAYVEEVGRAAIDLYGGRLAPLILGTLSDQEIPFESAALPRTPLRILLVGPLGAGKSSLLNAMLGENAAAVDALPATKGFSAYKAARPEMGELVLVDSPGLGPEAAADRGLADAIAGCDLLLWVTSAQRPDRARERAFLDHLARQFAEKIDLRQPPIVVALTHVDRLRPFNEWNPPYELSAAGVAASAKSASIRAAVQAAAAELALAESRVVPIGLRPGSAPYNLEALWARIAADTPAAQHTQLVRRLRTPASGWQWRRVLRQVGNAGRSVASSVPGWTKRTGRDGR
jgi:predicted GTPase